MIIQIRYKKPLELHQDLAKLVQDNHLDMDYTKNIVKLTKDNSNIIEKLIEDNYIPFSQMIYKHYCNQNGGAFPNTDKNAWKAVLIMIDFENSTQVRRFYKADFDNIIDYIVNPSNNFTTRLSKGDISLVDDINKQSTRNIKSLSSKICKYMAEYMGFKDKYFINDYYIRSMLPYYLDYYKVDWKVDWKNKYPNKKYPDLTIMNHRESLNYEELFLLLDALLNEVNKTQTTPLTKSELDHIIWYCYKFYDK